MKPTRRIATFCAALLATAISTCAQNLTYAWRDEGHVRTGGVAIDLPSGKLATIEGQGGVVKLWDQTTGAFLNSQALGRVSGSEPINLRPNHEKTKFLTWGGGGHEVWRMPEFAHGGPIAGSGEHSAFSNDGKYTSVVTPSWTYFFGGNWNENFISARNIGVFDVTGLYYYHVNDNVTRVDMSNLRNAGSFNILGGPKTDVVVTSDGNQIVTCNLDTVYSYNLSTGQQTGLFNATGLFLRTLAVNRDATMIAAGGRTTVRVWNKSNGAVLASLHVGVLVTGIDFSLDGSKVAVTDNDGFVRVYETALFSLVKVIGGPKGSLVVQDNARHTVLSSGRDGILRVRNSTTGQELRSWRVVETVENTFGAEIALSRDGSRVVTGSSYGGVALWNMEDGTKLWEVNYAQSRIMAVAFSPASPEICVSVRSGNVGHIDVISAVDGQFITSLGGNEYALNLAYSPDGTYIYLSGHDNFINEFIAKAVRRSDVTTIWSVQATNYYEQHFFSLSEGGSRLAVADGRQSVRIYNAANGTLERSIEMPGEYMAAILLSPNGQRLLASQFPTYSSGFHRTTLFLFDVSSGNRLGTWTNIDERFLTLAAVKKDGVVAVGTGSSVRAFKMPQFFLLPAASPR